jgi:V/A-type H+-transporting ATPase subunit I
MIVRMKRLTLLCLTSERDAALDELRRLGVVHVTDRREPSGDELEALRARHAAAERALAALPPAPEVPADTAGPSTSDAPAAACAEDALKETIQLVERRSELEARAGELSRELARYAGFGEFDLDEVRELEGAGVWTALAVTPPDERLTPPGGVVLTELRHDRDGRYLALAALGGRPESLPDLGGHYELVAWPQQPLASVRDELAAAENELAEVDLHLTALAPARHAVASVARAAADAVRFAEVRAGMEEAGELSVLSGYVPAAEQNAVRSAAGAHGWGVLLEDPEPGEDVPVQLRQARWVRPIRTVFDFLHIYPGYWEVDAGWVVLPFFSLFFAMIVGDAGYALLLLALTAVLQWRLKRVPSHVFQMMYIVGGVTLVWGVINGSYFGIPVLPPFLESLTVPWIQDRDNLIDLCFLIGAVHLSFAHVWNAASLVRSRTWLKVPAQVGWLLVVWSMFFIARQTVLGRDMPGFLLYVLLAGIVLVAVFMKTPSEFKESWIDHALLPLTMIGNFVDILSYIRLFAVGYASVAVLAAFNGMAADIGFDSVLSAIAASLLLLFANALNIVLAGLGVLVHAVRLNTLEFSTHKGLQWEGHNLYAPFASGRASR